MLRNNIRHMHEHPNPGYCIFGVRIFAFTCSAPVTSPNWPAAFQLSLSEISRSRLCWRNPASTIFPTGALVAAHGGKSRFVLPHLCVVDGRPPPAVLSWAKECAETTEEKSLFQSGQCIMTPLVAGRWEDDLVWHPSYYVDVRHGPWEY